MATTVASLRILLGLDSKDVRDGAGSVKSELKGIQGEANKTQSALSDIKKGIGQGLGVGIGIGGVQAASMAVQQLTGFLNDAVKAAQQDEQSVALLNAALKANVPAWTGASDAIDKQIAAAQRLGFTDDEVRGSLARLSAVTHDVNESLKIQQAAMDLARFKNIDLQSATEALVAVEAGRYRGLAALGINIKDIHSRTEALAAVQKIAAGSAEAWGKTNAGAATEAGIAFDEAQEKIGNGLLPVMTELSHGMRDVVAPALVTVSEHMDELGKVAVILGTTLAIQTTARFADAAIAAARLALAMAPLPASVLEAGAAMTITGTAAEGLAVGVNTASVAMKGFLPLAGLLAIAIEGINKPAVTQFLTDFNNDLPGATGKVGDLTAAFSAAGDTIGHVTAILDDNAAAETNNSAQLTTLAAAHGVVADSAAAAATSFVEFGAASIDSAAGLTAFAAASNSAADGATATVGPLSAEEAWLNRVAFAANVAGRNLAAMGTAAVKADQDTTARLRRLGEVPGLLPGGLVGGGGPTVVPGDYTPIDWHALLPNAPTPPRGGGGGGRGGRASTAAADAKRAADELDRARVASADDAFRKMADAAHKYFDELHKANLKAIDDAQKTADEQIEAQKRANLQPATAAEARLRAVQQARQLAGLQADLAAAKTPEERLRAQQALSDFQAQARIDFLRDQATAANQILDDQKKAQDKAFDDQRARENKRHEDQVNDFEKAGKNNADAYLRGVNRSFGGVTAGSTPSPAIAATAGLVYVGGGVKGDVYLDGNKVGEFIERYLAANASATTSGYTARHN